MEAEAIALVIGGVKAGVSVWKALRGTKQQYGAEEREVIARTMAYAEHAADQLQTYQEVLELSKQMREQLAQRNEDMEFQLSEVRNQLQKKDDMIVELKIKVRDLELDLKKARAGFALLTAQRQAVKKETCGEKMIRFLKYVCCW